MNAIQYVRKTDLARNTREIMRKVQRGQIAIVENHGQAEAAILDIVDYYILRAVARYHANPPLVEPGGISDEAAAKLVDPQERFDVVMAHYLSEYISTGRTAELLGMVWADMRAHFARLDVPLNLGPRTSAEAQDEVRGAMEAFRLVHVAK